MLTNYQVFTQLTCWHYKIHITLCIHNHLHLLDHYINVYVISCHSHKYIVNESRITSLSRRKVQRQHWRFDWNGYTTHSTFFEMKIYFFVFVFQLRNLLKGQRYTQVSRLRSNVYVVKGDTFMPKSVSGYLPPPWRKLAMHNSAHSFT